MDVRQNNKQRHEASQQQKVFAWENDIAAIKSVTMKQVEGVWVMSVNGSAGCHPTDIELWLWLNLGKARRETNVLKRRLRNARAKSTK